MQGMKASVFVPVKARHNAGCCLSCLVVGTSQLPALEKVPVSCLGLCGGWGTESGIHVPLHTVWQSSMEEKRRRCERRVSWWLGAMCKMMVSWAFSKTIAGADAIPLLPTPFWLFILWWHNIRNKNKIWPELEFFPCFSSLMWQQCWKRSRDHLPVREGMRLLMGTGVRWHGAGMPGGDRWLYLRKWEAVGSCTFGKWRDMRRGRIYQELFCSSILCRKKSLLVVELRNPGLALCSAGNTGRIFHTLYTVTQTANAEQTLTPQRMA